MIANAKHYVNNNQETNRGAVSENVDERTRFEIYYPPFEGAVKAGLGSIMCSCKLRFAVLGRAIGFLSVYLTNWLSQLTKRG